MTDKELLELAANAANEKGDRIVPTENGAWYEWHNGGANGRPWNPLTDDGDALRLAVKLRMNVFHAGIRVFALDEEGDIEEAEGHKLDPYAATRRCITHAAAEIAKQS
jgi:hypothetical protein